MNRQKNIDFAHVSGKLGLGDVPETWKDTWSQAMASYPGEDLYFLENRYLAGANKILLLENGALEALQSAAAAIRNEPCLCTLAWYLRFLLLNSQKDMEHLSFYFPRLIHDNDAVKDLFFAIILISTLEGAVRLHQARGIQSQVTRDTFEDFSLWMKHFHQTSGRWGLGEYNWLIRHFTGRLFRLGRLQFAFGTFKDEINVYRNMKNARVIAFYGEGARFRRDGRLDGTNDIFDYEGGWMSSFKTDEAFISGKPVSPSGRAIDSILRINRDEWKPVLAKGDSILEVHIPAGSNMSRDLCGDSFVMAMDMFPRCFPERKFCAFTCDTWLFDPIFQELLPPSSNIVNFQREFYIYPLPGSDKQTFERVFGERPDDLNTAPRDTLLRRSILDYYLKGGRLSNMGGFILKDDLSWGGEVYQKDWQREE